MTNKTLCISAENIVEEYEYARTEYKGSFRDSERDYWDGYMTAIEKLCGDVVLVFDEQ